MRSPGHRHRRGTIPVIVRASWIALTPILTFALLGGVAAAPPSAHPPVVVSAADTSVSTLVTDLTRTGIGSPLRPEHPRFTPRPKAESKPSGGPAPTAIATSPGSEAVDDEGRSLVTAPDPYTLSFSSKASRTRGQPLTA